MKSPSSLHKSQLYARIWRALRGSVRFEVEKCGIKIERATCLEDIGDGGGVLGSLSAAGDDGDGGPRHGGRVSSCVAAVSTVVVEVVEKFGGRCCGLCQGSKILSE
jgi:hypothetical protein